ncbi:hypothetical protein TREAZ_0607 [Leadbettera azotonutricia ZAS-9]|uniref:Uncharacterized protein n=2 Tax=Leadbettera azotonutricia TaxID=150829 RepID=F5YBH8_LEAAZ|nr:hypothetical protein TREAZ_0607 [Leadbettera azotonutricia ZAS-9]
MDDYPKEYTLDYAEDLAWCASGVRAIARAMWWYGEYKNKDDPDYEEDVSALLAVIDLLTEPIERLLFSGMPVIDPKEKECTGGQNER